MIKKSLCFIWKCFSCPVAVFTGMILISVIALGGALASELFLGLEPCRLCIYQRWPFVMTIIIGALGLILRQNNNLAKALTGLGSLIFLMNSMIAFYHTGVEQKWTNAWDVLGDIQDEEDDDGEKPENKERHWSDPETAKEKKKRWTCGAFWWKIYNT